MGCACAPSEVENNEIKTNNIEAQPVGVIRDGEKEDQKEDKVWAIGFGANLNAHHLADKKKVTVLDSCACKAPGFLFAFPSGGIDYVDPGFSAAFEQEGAEIHGLAFATSRADMDRINELEGGDRFYTAKMCTLHLYDGRVVEGQIYTRPVEKLQTLALPSKRYLNLIINGAKEAGLDAEYVKKLEA